MKIYKLIVSLFLAFSLTISATGCGSNASSVSAKTNDEFAEWVTADTGLDKEIFKAEWNSRRHYYSFEQEAYDDLVKIKNWCYENDRFDTNYKIEEYINTDALAEAFPDRVSWEATE